MASSQEISERLSKVLDAHPEIFAGYEKIEHILDIAREVIGDVDELEHEVDVETRTAWGAPRIVCLRLYFHKKTPGTILARFRIDVSAEKGGYKITSDNEATDEDIQHEIELGIERVNRWVEGNLGMTTAEALLAIASQELDRMAQGFGPDTTFYSVRTGQRLTAGFDAADMSLPMAYSEMTGRPMDNLTTGIVQVYHDTWGNAHVTEDESKVLEKYGWKVVSSAKSA